MPAVVGDVLRVDVVGDFDTTEDLVNTYQFRCETVVDGSDNTLLEDFRVFFRAQYDLMDALWSANILWRRVRCANITTSTLVGERDFTTPVTGTATGEQGAIQSAILLSLKTNVPRVVMRKYFPIAESSIDGTSRATTAAQTLTNNFGTLLLTVINAASGNAYRFGYLSPKVAGFVIPQSRQTSPIIATQRRRRPGVGS